MNQRTLKIHLKPSHPDYDVFKNQAVQVRRLYNGLNSVARIVHAQHALKLTTLEEQPADTRLLKVFHAEEWVSSSPHLASPYTYEKLRKNIEQVQDIQLSQKIAQRVGTRLSKSWKSFYTLRKQGLYSNPPGYSQTYGAVEYTKQALSMKRKGWVKPTGWSTGVKLPSYVDNIQAARLTHSHGKVFTLEIIYAVNIIETKPEGYSAAIDFGLNNLITLITTQPGYRPKIISGRQLKSINQYYNKTIAETQRRLRKGGETKSKKLDTLWAKRSRKVNHVLHSVSSQIIRHLENTGVNTLIIGWNTGFKDKINIGRKNNQQFTQIPHAKLRDMLSYKAQGKGIQVIIQEESYTSKASFKDSDFIPCYPTKTKPVFSGTRISRGLYKTKDKTLIHADVNGAWNIHRKSNPTTRWSSGIIVMPERLQITL